MGGLYFISMMRASFQKRSFHYTAFGLTVESDFCLPDLFESVGPDIADTSDVTIVRLNEGDDLPTKPSESSLFDRPGCVVNISPGFVSYSWNDLGTVVVRNGNEVIVKLAPEAVDDDLAPFLTGAVLGNLLEQRGKMVLHGSAVSLDGIGVAFLGEKGAGKSTLALHLQNRGSRLLTDDLLPIAVVDDQVKTIPGSQQIKVWPDSAVSVGLIPDSMPKISKFIDKRSFRSACDRTNTEINLDRIYILEEAPEIRIERIEPSAAFIELTRHTYIGRYLQATKRYAEHFNIGSAIVRSIPVFRLHRPHDFDSLPEVISVLIDHIEK